MRGWKVVGVMLTGAVLMTACTSKSGAFTQADGVSGSAGLREIAVQPAELGTAEALITQQCLKEKGFDAPLGNVMIGGVQNLPTAPTQATQPGKGYGSSIQRGDPLGRYAAQLPEAERARFDLALNGTTGGGKAAFTTPSGWSFGASRRGCLATGRAAVYGSVDNWLVAFYLPQDLNLIAADVYLDAAVRAVADVYQRCMATAGYTVALPQEAAELAAGWVKADPDAVAVAQAEVELATADTQCQRLSDIVPRWEKAFERDAADWVRDNDPQVRHAVTIVRESHSRARKLLGQSISG